MTNGLLRGGKKFCHLLLIQPSYIINWVEVHVDVIVERLVRVFHVFFEIINTEGRVSLKIDVI